MLLQVDYKEVQNTGAKGEVDGKRVNFYMIINVDETNFVDAVERFSFTKGVVAFNFVGNPTFLQTESIVRTVEKPILLRIPLENVNTIDIQQTMIQYPTNVRIVFVLPKDFKDMRLIYNESQKYANIRFEGGKLIRLIGCKIGAIGVEDIPRKVVLSRVSLTPVGQGDYSVMKEVTLDEVDYVEYYQFRESKQKALKMSGVKASSESASKSQAKPKAKPKKQLTSLFDLTSTSGTFDNF